MKISQDVDNTSGCGSPEYANDQWCDDENNNAGCNYDGGACCDNIFSGWNSYCSSCQCLNPTSTTTTTTTTPPSGGDCGSPNWANDEYCDDENNNAGCNFDGGACCNNNIAGWNNYCTKCQCLEPQNCVAIGIWSLFGYMHNWCNVNCNHNPPYCPPDFCSC